MKKTVLLVFTLFTAHISFAQSWQHIDTSGLLVNNGVEEVVADQYGNLYVTTCYIKSWERYCDVYKWDAANEQWIDTLRGEGAHIDNAEFTAIDSQGHFWIVNLNGVFKYDGKDFEYFSLPKSEHLPLEVAADKKGTLWYSGVSGGGTFYTGALEKGQWVDHSRTFNTDPLDFMVTGNRGETWAYSTGVLVNLTDNISSNNINLKGRYPFGAAFDDQGRPVLVLPSFVGLNQNCLFRFDNGNLSAVDHNGLSIGFYHKAIIDQAGNYYVASLGQGIRKVTDTDNFSYKEKDGLPSDTVYDIFEDSEGIIWIGTANGAATIKDGKLDSLTEIKGVSGFKVRRIMERKPGELWLGTTKGLFKYTWTPTNATGKIPSAHVRFNYHRAAKTLQVSGAELVGVQYRILDVQGKRLGNGTLSHSQEIELTGLSEGIYLIELIDGNFRYTHTQLVAE